MNILPFAPRTARRLPVCVTSPACDLRLRKGEHSRRYVVQQGRVRGDWQGHVWCDEVLHHHVHMPGVTAAAHQRAQYEQELLQLVGDGWVAEVRPSK